MKFNSYQIFTGKGIPYLYFIIHKIFWKFPKKTKSSGRHTVDRKFEAMKKARYGFIDCAI
jgi:hypothetical protein